MTFIYYTSHELVLCGERAKNSSQVMMLMMQYCDTGVQPLHVQRRLGAAPGLWGCCLQVMQCNEKTKREEKTLPCAG